MSAIAFVTHSQYPTEVRARRMAEACAAAGHVVDVFCLCKPGELPDEELNGVSIHRLPMFRRQGAGPVTYMSEYARFLLMAAHRLARSPQRTKYDLVQIYNPPDFLVYAALAPRLFNKTRVIYDVRDVAPELFLSRFRRGATHPLARLLHLFERMAWHYADAITVCTSYVYDLLAARGAPCDKMHIVMNLPDDRIFGTAAAGCEDGRQMPATDCSAERFHLVYHGGMLERYGPDILVRAIALLRERIPGLRADLYGTGDFLPAVKALVTELKVSGIVRIHGFIPTELVAAAVSDADLGIVPMRQDLFTDGLLPTKLMELAALQVPAVVARTLTTQRYFSDQMVRYFPPGDVDALASAIFDLYCHPEERSSLANRAASFTRLHNWPTEKANYLALIDAVIRGQK